MFNTRKEPGRGHITFTMINALVVIFAFSNKLGTVHSGSYFGQVLLYGFVALMLLHVLLCRYNKLSVVMIIANLIMDATIYALSLKLIDTGFRISQAWLFIFPFIMPIFSWIVHSFSNSKYYYDNGRRIYFTPKAANNINSSNRCYQQDFTGYKAGHNQHDEHHGFNPASGLAMLGNFDTAGNQYGFNSGFEHETYNPSTGFEMSGAFDTCGNIMGSDNTSFNNHI